MITKDGRETPIAELTRENYVVPKGEEKDYHCIIEVKQFDQKTGKRLSRPRLQKFGRKMFEQNVMASLQKQGYEITILHNPREWAEKTQKEAAARAKAQAEAQKAAEEKRFQDAVAAEVAKQVKAALAEQKKKEKKNKETEEK